ncbi:MAG: serine--tRNA ligase, partial [Candidatus Omnitrophica bacterium]|nr:serine--tRNA ligase [Candidatus Omnitrophota bacterium]
MLDLKFIRENPDRVAQGLAAKGVSVDIQTLLDLDLEKRTLQKKSEELKARRNSVSDEIARLKKQGQSADEIIVEMKGASQKIADFDSKVGEISEKIDKIALSIPNLPMDDVPVCKGAQGNKVVREWGQPRELSFKAKDHLDLASGLGLFSMEKGSKITGGGFPVYFGMGARLERA